MKIDWKTRFRNPVFWAHIAAAFFAPILAHCGVNWSQVTTWGLLFQLVAQAFQNPVVVVAILISVWNCIFNPTTKGICDGKSLCNSPTDSQ